jgi:hypothetical protein
MAQKMDDSELDELVIQAIRAAQSTGNPITVTEGPDADKRLKRELGPTVGRVHQADVCKSVRRLTDDGLVIKAPTGNRNIVRYTSTTPRAHAEQQYNALI